MIDTSTRHEPDSGVSFRMTSVTRWLETPFVCGRLCVEYGVRESDYLTMRRLDGAVGAVSKS